MLDDLRQMESLSRDMETKMQHFGLGDATDENRSNLDVDGCSNNDENGKACKSQGKQRKKLKSGKAAKITTCVIKPQA